MTPNQPHPYGVQAPPPPRTGPSAARIVAFVIAGVAALCVIGGVFVAVVADQPAAPQAVADQDAANRAAAATTAPTSAAPTTPPVTGKAAAPAATTTAPKPTKTTPAPVIIGEGTYRVGEDIPAGRYKVVERADGECYWSRSKGGDIIDNSISGGFPSFTARTGEDVEIGYACPEFKRIGK